ncbi:MAG: nuclear transport factor 2 family protein [Caulobacter sp.]|nr:nuclear transport factor 2 family protein [Caulobacter sp.]
MTPKPIQAWHAYLDKLDPALLHDLLAEDVVFESPVVHTPQVGRSITTKYLLGAAAVLNTPDFRYLNDWFSERSAVLEFTTTIDGITVNGVDMIHWNDAGKITHFKVMIRPLKAINLVHQKMGAMLAAM